MGVLPGQKKSGRNNEVVVRRGSTVLNYHYPQNVPNQEKQTIFGG